jgi:uncharacterized protein involved in outer membrane biogenesis
MAAMRISRNRVVAVIALTAIAGAAVFYSLGVVVHNQRGQVEQELRKLLGNDASFAAVETSLWGGIGFTVKEFRVADNPEFAATPLVQARELTLGVSLWRLVLGRLAINSLTFTQPEFQIITNEDGMLNVAALASRKKELAEFPRLRTGPTERKGAPLNFLITRLRVIDGRVDFIDRSISAPAELRIKHIDLDVGGLDLAARAKIRLVASLTEGLGRDLLIEGDMGPHALGRNWSQQPVNLEMRFDSLYLPTLAHAIPFLRDRIPRELDITGPMYLHARLSGTLQQPRFTDITLKVPFLGSSDYNAILEGKAEFTQSRNWADVFLAGKLTLTDISLSQFQRLPLLRQALPADFVAGGSVNSRSSFEGTWKRLRVGTLLEASASELRVPGWLRKPAGMRAQVRAQFSRNEGGFVLHPSVLSLGETKILVSGALKATDQSRLSIRIRAGQSSLESLAPLLAPATFDGWAGQVDWDLLLERRSAAPANSWEARGVLNLSRVALRHKASGEKVEQLDGSVSFFGNRARAQNLSFRIGSSAASATLDIADLNRFSGRYTLRSPDLNLSDLLATAGRAARLKDFVAAGDVTFSDDQPRLEGTLSSPDATFQDVTYRNLRADVTWTPAGLRVKELRAEAFDGELRMSGDWNFGGEQEPRVRFAPRLEALSLQELSKHFASGLKIRFDGKMDFRGGFAATGSAGETLQKTLKGSGVVSIRGGAIKDFNLIARLFYRGAGREQGAQPAQRISANLAAVLGREDTPVHNLNATLTLESERIRADGLILSTPEYQITGAGWIAMDGTTQWNGALVFSPTITRELQREHGAIRYFLDRKGRLSVSFRIDGKLPNVRIRPENRALAQAFRWGTWQRGDDDAGRKDRKDKNWLSDSLDRLLQR